MNYNGKIIVLAYPDTFVTVSDEWVCKLLPLVGLGTWDYIKAGHAALILIENETGLARYFDFGRYVTPKGYGRVRGKTTDVELEIPFKAEINREGNSINLETFLKWLSSHPEKTHGEGRLLASVCDVVNFELAENYIKNLQEQGSIPYGAFDKMGSNCSRFVTDTILSATSEKRIIKALNFNKKFTPSTVGNVEKASLGMVYEVLDGHIRHFYGSALKENLTNYFGRKPNSNSAKSIAISNLPSLAQELRGTGSSAWFELVEEELPQNHFRIRRYNEQYEIDFDGVYISNEFDGSKPYQFTFDSHCEYCHVLQNNKKIKFECVGDYAAFSSSQKVHSA
ncbi:MAG: hypothetical protein JKY22_11445 [Flavobacteriaceae bacterium]|nr:hypothetical protein [Flavobacteriaceae bacterium]